MSNKKLPTLGAGSDFENLTATINDVVFCVQELRGQYEIIRQQVTYLSKQDETLLLQDAEIQTLKVTVNTIKDERKKERNLSSNDSNDLLKMKLLVRDFYDELSKRSSLHTQALELLKAEFDSWKTGQAPKPKLDALTPPKVDALTPKPDAPKKEDKVVAAIQELKKEKKSGGILSRMGLSRSPKRDTDKSGKDKSASPVGRQDSPSLAVKLAESPGTTPQKNALASKPGATSNTPQRSGNPEVSPNRKVAKGSTLKCVGNDEQDHAEIYESMVSDEIIATVNRGHTVTASGDAVDVEGYMMVPIIPKGAVQMDLFEHIQVAGEKLAAETAKKAAEAKAVAEAAKTKLVVEKAQPSRAELISKIFSRFDSGNKGALREADLLKFMKETGDIREVEFEGSVEDWAREYKDVCLEGGWDARLGLNKTAFSKLLNDEENEEYYCTDKQLVEIVGTLQTQGAGVFV